MSEDKPSYKAGKPREEELRAAATRIIAYAADKAVRMPGPQLTHDAEIIGDAIDELVQLRHQNAILKVQYEAAATVTGNAMGELAKARERMEKLETVAMWATEHVECGDKMKYGAEAYRKLKAAVYALKEAPNE